MLSYLARRAHQRRRPALPGELCHSDPFALLRPPAPPLLSLELAALIRGGASQHSPPPRSPKSRPNSGPFGGVGGVGEAWALPGDVALRSPPMSPLSNKHIPLHRHQGEKAKSSKAPPPPLPLPGGVCQPLARASVRRPGSREEGSLWREPPEPPHQSWGRGSLKKSRFGAYFA
jgi:hypothetical protein